ncbi:MAG: helix-turn-helix transcriptional regulator [Lysinibacillus sp.]
MENNRWGKRIRAFRKLKRIQQVAFAKEIGISATTLGKIERGERVPSEELLTIIAQTLAIDIKELMGEGRGNYDADN